MDTQGCINLENNESGSDALTLILTIFIILLAIISAECNKH